MTTKAANTSQRSNSSRILRITRRLAVVYLLIVLGMMFLETWLVYPIPQLSWGNWKPTGFEYEDVHFTSADGTKLHGWFVPHPHPVRSILYCHGNGEDVAANGEWAAHLSRELQANVFVFDYRGYGHSEGRPHEAGCIADGCAAEEWLAKRSGIQPADVVVFGRSLGSAVAVGIAAQNGAKALILESAFSTMPDAAAVHYPWLPVRWVMKNRYDNLTRIKKYEGPLLQCHGTADSIVPMALGRQLFDAAPSANKKWIEFPARDHNDPSPEGFLRQLGEFLDSQAGSK
jgi:fermentation-respiration switch protein FrsA (DUF1100 family)